MDLENGAPRSSASMPSPYNTVVPEDLLTNQPTMKDDGRVNIDMNSRAVKYLSLLPNFKPSPADTPVEPHASPPAYPLPEPHRVPWESFPVKLNIVIQVVGSRGDVQPFVALGTELRRHGHRVRLATHAVFDSFVREAGLEFYSIGGDPAELMAYMVRNPGLIPSMKSLRAGDVQKKRSLMAEILKGCWLSCISPDPMSSDPFVADAIIANPPSFAHIHCAQALGIPVHIMFTMPWTSTVAFPHPLVNIELSLGSGSEPLMANYISYGVVEFLTWQGLGDLINELRENIDLEHIAFSDGPCLIEKLEVPVTYCWSPALVPKPADWGSNIDVCGFFFREPPCYTPAPELHAFLQAGPPPVYIGFGSIVIDDPHHMSELILEAVRITGTRALISRGWSKLDGPESRHVMFLGDCPHEWLFQHVAAVVHHGGAGTTACGLLNGRPTTIVPFFGDQPFWGNMVAAAGAGPAPIPQKSLSVDNLVEAIRFCMTREAAQAAEKIAAKMRIESGVKAAAASFHAHLPRDRLECDIIKGQPAVWTCSKKRRRLKLCKTAAEILLSHLKVDVKSLEMYESHRTVIQARRWEPMTGTIAAAIGVGADLAKSAANTVIKPIQAYQQRGAIELDGHDDWPSASAAPSSHDSIPTRAKHSRGCLSTTKALTTVSAHSMSKFLEQFARGVVTIPFAFTEGFRSVPLLYGDELRDYGEIYDWKTGVTFGVNAVVFGVIDGVAGLFILPYKGARQEGVIGAAKGVGKGVAGLSSKVFTATLGWATYPLQGIYMSIWRLANSKARRSIQQARLAEGRYLADKSRAMGISDGSIMEMFDAMMAWNNANRGVFR
ncbi:hypothetical protein B0T10DRAFT_595972 [Thelonectria olida]|uniref:Glycosyltransferase family 28 N-terminal domain-containing protein n=1 Tax=Thelonectria olida TaxID=1576542 RepID=A0A9P8VP17_9HYPO|nr:hypothetical protein B0T10DRAFT_595972 [Thelonectria olida]